MMHVAVHLYSQAKPIHYNDVQNVYQKGDLLCILLSPTEVHKIPIQHIFRVEERYTKTK